MSALTMLLLALVGCKDKDPDPLVCNDAHGWAGELAFEETTEPWGLVGVTGTRMSAADLDGDGWLDLVVSEASAFGRTDYADPDSKMFRWMLMNREAEDGSRTFVDETEARGFFTSRDGSGLSRPGMANVFADIDNDGDLDGFSGQFFNKASSDDDSGERSEIMINDGTGHFTLADPSDPHVSDGYATGSASFVDVNADGLIDLWVVGWYEEYGYLYGTQDQLYLGQGDGTFWSVTEEAGLELDRGSRNSDWTDGEVNLPGLGAAACDLDGDSLPDLLASNYGRSFNHQWMNQGDGSFVEVGMESGFAADANEDYSDNHFYRCYCEVYGCDPDPGPSSLGNCESYAAYWSPGWDDLPNRLTGNSFCAACGDVDRDGDLDLLTGEIVHWHIGHSSDGSELLLNDGSGNFTRPGNEATGLARDWQNADWNEGDLFTALQDLDNDGALDAILASTEYPDTHIFLFQGNGDGTFVDVSDSSGLNQPWPAGLLVADFDRDGDLDVITGGSTSRDGTPWEDHGLHFHENTLGPANFVEIELVGTSANRTGIGARIEVTAGGITQTTTIDGGGGHEGMQHSTLAHVGLGEVCTIDELKITWPGGAVDSWTDVPGNQRIRLTQGGEVESQGLPG
jgi:hypothetical protein